MPEPLSQPCRAAPVPQGRTRRFLHLCRAVGELRDRAHVMPTTQPTEVLEREYGADWHRRFRRFSFEPVAAVVERQIEQLRELSRALRDIDLPRTKGAALEIGFIGDDDPPDLAEVFGAQL